MKDEHARIWIHDGKSRESMIDHARIWIHHPESRESMRDWEYRQNQLYNLVNASLPSAMQEKPVIPELICSFLPNWVPDQPFEIKDAQSPSYNMKHDCCLSIYKKRSIACSLPRFLLGLCALLCTLLWKIPCCMCEQIMYLICHGSERHHYEYDFDDPCGDDGGPTKYCETETVSTEFLT